MKRHLWAAAALAALGVPAGAVQFLPVVRLEGLGGQFFFEGEQTSFSGNANWLVSPAVKLSDKDMLIPTVSGSYRRTREVRELLGGGFLTQETLDNTASLKYVRRIGSWWSVKPSVSWKNELVTESLDEELGKGLFDYNKASAGLEAEYRDDLLSFRQSVTGYGVRYPRYSSLSSGSDEFAAEIASGDRVLDFNAVDYSVSAEWLAAQHTLLSVSGLASYRDFLDQRIVTQSGTYTDQERRDFYALLLAGGQQKLPDWGVGPLRVENAVGLSGAYALLFSNQHNYDATRTQFNPHYYDYGEATAAPAYSARFNKKLSAVLSYEYARRDYIRRPVQDVEGDYGTKAVFLNTHTASVSLTYPIAWGLSVKASGSYRRSLSNMKYEQTYRYNYWSAHYFAGLSYSL